ncbi:hypothetical protein RRG08_051019 [Elysia crispata]|uniref:Uncharacterized protein n=1 Tax=Elysia crispata TaxID=231223 RepID=A0AAE0Z6B4_9GAST|nr:hypothetical protein RRG08_051019 [Elysia crispata]
MSESCQVSHRHVQRLSGALFVKYLLNRYRDHHERKLSSVSQTCTEVIRSAVCQTCTGITMSSSCQVSLRHVQRLSGALFVKCLLDMYKDHHELKLSSVSQTCTEVIRSAVCEVSLRRVQGSP